MLRPADRTDSPRAAIRKTAANARRAWPALIAGFLGWTLDAFDFFLVVFCLTAIGKEFHQTDKRRRAFDDTDAGIPAGGRVPVRAAWRTATAAGCR